MSPEDHIRNLFAQKHVQKHLELAPIGTAPGGSPVDRGKRGIKRSVAVDAKGIPLAVVTASANRHDSPLLPDPLDA